MSHNTSFSPVLDLSSKEITDLCCTVWQFIAQNIITLQMFRFTGFEILWIGKLNESSRHVSPQSVKHYINAFPLLTFSNIFPLILIISSQLKQISISTCKSPKKVHTFFILQVEDNWVIKLSRM